MDSSKHNDDITRAPDELLDELIQHYPPGGSAAETPYKRALAEKHRRIKAAQAAEQAWKNEITRQITELKKPHRPTFRLLVISVILAAAAAAAALLALPQVQQACFGTQQAQQQKTPSQQHEQQQPTPKQEQRNR